MKSNSINQGEYPVVAMYLKDMLAKDKAEIQPFFKSMDEKFDADFENAIVEVQAVPLTATGLMQQKDASLVVYGIMENVMKKLPYLKIYAVNAGVEKTYVEKALKFGRVSDTEGLVKSVKEAVMFYNSKKAQLVDMPDDFLEKLSADVVELEKMNVSQEDFKHTRRNMTAENAAKYDMLDDFIKRVSRAGKTVFKGTSKADNYNISKILSNIRSASRPASSDAKTDVK